MVPRKLVSGGQTGADRAALDFALAHGIEAGGWAPKGLLAEDGRIPERYSGLRESDSPDPAVRTALNVRDSDATLIVSHGPLSGGSLLTLQEATGLGRPVLHLDLALEPAETAGMRLRHWLGEVRPAVLNVAGPRASEDPRIAAATDEVLTVGMTGFLTVWEFTVAPGLEARFIALYGPDGGWARLFRTAPEFLGTELLQAPDAPDHFMTTDRWTSQEAFERFRRERSMEYDALDAEGAELTTSERRLGEFTGVTRR